MAFGIVAGVVGAVGAVASASAQRSAAKKAANAQRETSDKQIELQREQMKRAEQVAKPYREAGAAADQRLSGLWDVDPSDPYMQGRSSPYNPGGAYGGRPGAGSAAPVFMAGSPSASVPAGRRMVPQVGVRPRPTPPQAPAPAPSRIAGIPANWAPSTEGAPPLPGYTPPASEPATPQGATAPRGKYLLGLPMPGVGSRWLEP